MTCDAILDFVTEEVEQRFEDVHNLRDLRMGGRSVHHTEGPPPEAPLADVVAVGTTGPTEHTSCYDQLDVAMCAFVTHNLSEKGHNRSKWEKKPKYLKTCGKGDVLCRACHASMPHVPSFLPIQRLHVVTTCHGSYLPLL